MKNFNKEWLRLYAVTDRAWLGDETLYEQVEKALRGGATMVQIREKELDEAHFEEEAKLIQKLCRTYQVPLIINDNVALAKRIDADGVHIGQSDMEMKNARAILGEDKIIGVTAKTIEQAQAAEAELYLAAVPRRTQSRWITLCLRKSVQAFPFRLWQSAELPRIMSSSWKAAAWQVLP